MFQTSVECSVEATRRDLVLIFNLRQKIRRLKIEIEELTQYGTAKQPGSNEWIEEDPETEEMQKDPTARRNGDLCSPPARATLLKTIAEANACLHKVLFVSSECSSKLFSESSQGRKRSDKEGTS